MKHYFKTYDVADYITSEKDMALYLEACFEEASDDASTIAAALGDIARAKGMSDIAAARGYIAHCPKTGTRASRQC